MLEVHKPTNNNQNGAAEHLRQENPRPAARVDNDRQTRAVAFDQKARLLTARAVTTTDLPRRIRGAGALGSQQAVLAHHKLGTVGVDRPQDTGASGKLGNTLRVIGDKLGRQIHMARAEPA